MDTSDCIIPIFLQAMLYIIDFNTVFIIENMESRIEVDPMLSLINPVLFLIPLKFKDVQSHSPHDDSPAKTILQGNLPYVN